MYSGQHVQPILVHNGMETVSVHLGEHAGRTAVAQQPQQLPEGIVVLDS